MVTTTGNYSATAPLSHPRPVDYADGRLPHRFGCRSTSGHALQHGDPVNFGNEQTENRPVARSRSL